MLWARLLDFKELSSNPTIPFSTPENTASGDGCCFVPWYWMNPCLRAVKSIMHIDSYDSNHPKTSKYDKNIQGAKKWSKIPPEQNHISHYSHSFKHSKSPKTGNSPTFCWSQVCWGDFWLSYVELKLPGPQEVPPRLIDSIDSKVVFTILISLEPRKQTWNPMILISISYWFFQVFSAQDSNRPWPRARGLSSYTLLPNPYKSYNLFRVVIFQPLLPPAKTNISPPEFSGLLAQNFIWTNHHFLRR